tara:strand:+ start:166 stop:597 length:432 start_codon:yes stop_codon:yes gene_type:complete
MQPFTLYREHYDDATANAQRNLQGRTHYVDPETLRYFQSRVLESYITDGGCLFALIESYTPAPPEHLGARLRRFVVFDVCGRIVERPALESGWRTTKQARAAMWKYLNGADARAITAEAIERERRYTLDALDRLAQDAQEATR